MGPAVGFGAGLNAPVLDHGHFVAYVSGNIMLKLPPILVVSGASGSGKTTICRILSNEFGLYYSVSYTTRAKRDREVNARDYHFVSHDKFKHMIAADDLVEWAQVYNNFYGTSRHLIEDHLKRGRGVILDLDTQGAANIKKAYPAAVLVFLKTVTLDDLRHRLVKRGRDSQAEIERRLAYAQNELAKVDQYDHVILNDNLDRAVDQARQIIKTLI